MSQYILLEEAYHKLQKLVKYYEELKKENVRLKKEIEQKEQIVTSNKEEIKSLKDQMAILQSTGPLENSNKKELQKRINQYISDINKAIVLLNE